MTRTPSDAWKDNIAGLHKNCQDISKLSKKIRYAGVINRYGRTLTGILRPGIRPLLDSGHAKDELFLISSLLNMRSSTAKPLGILDHITLQHEKVYIVLLQKNDRVYYISLDADVKNISKLILRIKKAV